MRLIAVLVLTTVLLAGCAGEEQAARSPRTSGPGVSAVDGATPTVGAQTSLVTPPSGRVSAVTGRFRVGGNPCGLVGSGGSVWVTDAKEHRLIELDGRSGKVLHSFDLDPQPCELVSAGGALWVVTQLGVLDRFDLRTRKVRAVKVGFTSYEPIVAFGFLWVSNRGDRTVSKIDTRRGTVVATVPTPGLQPGGLVAAGGSIWVGNDTAGATTLGRLDPHTGTLTSATAGRRPAFVAAAGGSVWVANEDDGTVTRLDERTGAVRGTAGAGTRPVNLAVGPGPRPEVWVPDDEGDTLTRIDALSGAVLERLAAGHGPAVVTAVGGDVWVSNFEDGSVWRVHPGNR
jgi:virginiamycin B lyase